MRYFIHLAYKGTKYQGWQMQSKVRSVQAVLEKHISSLLHEPKKVHPCGRTDSGVHASQFFGHLECEKAIDFDFVFRMNKLLPADIAVYDLIEVPPRGNAQLDAISRTYHYHFHLDKNPFLAESSAWYGLESLDVVKMKKALPLLKKYTDFHSMCLQPDLHNHTFCMIHEVKLESQFDESRFRLEITADRFLRGMIRLLAARLMDIGTGKLSLDEFEHCFQTGERVRFHTSAHPQGLFLSKVIYPFLDVPTNALFRDDW